MSYVYLVRTRGLTAGCSGWHFVPLNRSVRLSKTMRENKLRHRRKRLEGILHKALESAGPADEIERISQFVPKNAPNPALRIKKARYDDWPEDSQVSRSEARPAEL